MKKERNLSNPLIFLCWLVYATSYLGKVNYSANITQIVDFFHVTKAEAGLAPTFFFFAYGIGQVVNGLLCNKYPIKWTILFSLGFSSVLNFLVGVTTNFAIVKWVWLLNGFTLSLLWPLLVRLLSSFIARKDLDRANVIIGTTVPVGTLVIYALSSLYATFGGYQLAFYTAAAADMAVALVWLFTYNKSVANAKQVRDSEIAETVANPAKPDGEERIDPRILKMVIVFLCIFAVGVNLVKDGLNTWVPSILKEEYALSNSLSILLTLFLPMVAIFGVPVALFFHKRISDYVTNSAVGFVLIGITVVLIMWSLQAGVVLVMLAGLIITALLSGFLNSLLTSVFPMNMRTMVNSGTLAGVINGCCYLGSTVSSYGLGYIADQKGWMAVFMTLLLFCGFACVCWLVYSIIKKHC